MIKCELLLRPGPASEINFSFLLSNQDPDPLTLSYFYPFLEFQIEIFAAGRPVPVHEPEYDIPIRPEKRLLAAGESLTLHTPASLCFAPEGGEKSDDLCWIIESPPQAILIKITLALKDLPPCTCQGVWAG